MNRLIGVVVKASASGAAGPLFYSRLRRGDFYGSSHTNDFNISTPVATLSGAWRNRVGAGTGRIDVCILQVSEFDLQLLSECGSTYNCLSRSIRDTPACCWNVKQPTNQQQHKNRKHHSSPSPNQGKSSHYQNTVSSFTADDSSTAGRGAQISPRIVQPAILRQSPQGLTRAASLA